MNLFCWRSDKKRDWKLTYKGNGKRPEKDIDLIKSFNLDYLDLGFGDAVYFYSTLQEAQKLKQELSSWKLSRVRSFMKLPRWDFWKPRYIVTMPENRAREGQFSGREENRRVSKELISDIRNYLIQRGGKEQVSKVMKTFRNAEVTSWHIVDAIHKSNDIMEDGTSVYLTNQENKKKIFS